MKTTKEPRSPAKMYMVVRTKLKMLPALLWIPRVSQSVIGGQLDVERTVQEIERRLGSQRYRSIPVADWTTPKSHKYIRHGSIMSM